MGQKMEFPILLKYKYHYTYAKTCKEKNIYARVLRKDLTGKAFKVLLIDENGKMHGRHYDRKVNYTSEDLEKYKCVEPPQKIAEIVEELKQIWL